MIGPRFLHSPRHWGFKLRKLNTGILLGWLIGVPLLLFVDSSIAHDVSSADRQLLKGNSGNQAVLYAWLGAKHMITGYDHLLFLAGVIFYLRRIQEVALLVSLFALGHSITLIGGVLSGLHVNAFLVDAIIGFSVVYKGFDNLGGFTQIFAERPNERLAVLLFGLFHGLGLASKLEDLGLPSEGLLGNLIAFNIGVELGQFAALLVMLLLLRLLFVRQGSSPENRKTGKIAGTVINTGLMLAGFSLMAYQLARFWAT